MTKLGSNSKITAPRSVRPQIRALFEALGVSPISPLPDMDAYRGGAGSIGFQFVDDAAALSVAQMRIAPWLEIEVDDPARAGAALDALDIPRLDYFDKEHAYFIAPGGLVFRLCAAS